MTEPVLAASYPGRRQEQIPALSWQTDLDVARATSRGSGRPLLVYVRADWSVSCTVMERDVWPDPEARQAAARFIPLMIDVTDVDDSTTAELALELQAETVPTVLVVAADGSVVGKHVGAMTLEQLRALLADR